MILPLIKESTRKIRQRTPSTSQGIEGAITLYQSVSARAGDKLCWESDFLLWHRPGDRIYFLECHDLTIQNGKHFFSNCFTVPPLVFFCLNLRRSESKPFCKYDSPENKSFIISIGLTIEVHYE